MSRTYGTAELKGDEWRIKADPHVSILLKRLFKRSDRGVPGEVRFTNSPATCRDLEWFCQRYPLDVKHSDAMSAGAAQHRDTILRVEDILGDKFVPRAFPMALQPRNYQARAAEVCLANGFLLDASEVGLGKSCVGITVITDPRARPAVVVTMTHLPYQWAREFRKFAPDLRVHVVTKAVPYPIDFMGHQPDVVVLSYSKLAGWGDVLGKTARCVVFDEVQELRHAGSNKYEGAKKLVENATFRCGLSATPIYNYGDEIFNVLDILKPGVLGNRGEFLNEWCKPIGMGKWAIKEPRAFGSWCRETSVIVRHTRKEVGRELPPVIPIVQKVSCDTRELDRVAGSAATLAKLILAQGETHKGAKMQASEEFTNLLRQATGISKAPYVADFVRLLVESGESVLLAGWHREVYSLWDGLLRDVPHVYYTGTESPAQKEESRRLFMEGKAKVMFISLRSGAGLDGLQEASKVVCIGELDWSPGVHEQLIGRLARDGQTEPVVAYYLVSDHGSDPIVSEVLGLKRTQVDGIRDPLHGVVQKIAPDADRVKKLAAAFLKSRGIPLPVASPLPARDSILPTPTAREA